MEESQLKMIVGLIVLNIIGFALSQQIHDETTSEELAQLFPMAGTEAPEYEIIPIHRSKVQKRDIYGRHIQVKAFGQHIGLYLNPLEGVLASSETPVFTVTSGFNVVRRQDIMPKVIGKLYQDEQEAATIAINEIPDGNVELNGIIGSNNVFIKSIPNKFVNYIKRLGRSVDNIQESESGNYTYHIAYKLPPEPEHMKLLPNPFHNSLRFKRSIPDVIYPEIMVIIDYPLFKLMERNFYYAVGYVLAFVNGVDFKYRTLENPKFRLNIAGIVIATQQDALEYTRYRTPYPPYDLNAQFALTASETWLAELETRINPYNFDAAITLTPQVLCNFDGNRCKRGVIGFAHIGLHCSTEQAAGRVYRRSSGIVHDKFNFEGIRTTAHELGHLFGVNHDGQTHNIQCNPERGHIMTPSVKFTINGSDWSYCSIREFERFLSQDPICLYNKPKGGEIYPRFLPGKLMDANQQCLKMEGTRAFEINEKTCIQLKCVARSGYNWVGYNEAADGTLCGQGKMCLHGRCIYELEITN